MKNNSYIIAKSTGHLAGREVWRREADSFISGHFPQDPGGRFPAETLFHLS